jgi:hypothetical protein
MPASGIQRSSSKKPNQEPAMKRYRTATPRAAMLIAAVTMSALSLGLSVLPAALGSGSAETQAGIAAGARPPNAAAVARIGPAITVYGVREHKTAFEPARRSLPTGKEEG